MSTKDDILDELEEARLQGKAAGAARELPYGYKPYIAKEFNDAGYEVYYRNKETGDKHFMVFRSGRVVKPTSTFTVRAGQSIQRALSSAKSGASYAKDTLDRAAQDRQKKVDAKANHELKIGDQLYTSSGATMTMVSFFQIIDIKGLIVTAQRVGMKAVTGSLGYQGSAVPDGAPFGEKITGRIVDKVVVSLTSYKEKAYKWTGSPVTFNYMD